MAGPRRDERPVAWCDESLNPEKTLYVLSAAVYPSVRAARHMAGQLERAAKDFGVEQIHANAAAAAELDNYEKIISADEELLQITVVHAPVNGMRQIEEARQRCLAELAVRLAKRDVRVVTLDSRDDLHHGHRPDQLRLNARDRETIASLKAAAAIAPGFKLVHADDRDDHRLWIPDVIAFAVYRALSCDDLERLRNLATAGMYIYPAEQLPAQRAVEGNSRSANRELGLALARMRVAAQLGHAEVARNAAYAKGDREQAEIAAAAENELQAAVARLGAAKAAAKLVAKSITEYEYSHRRVRTVRQLLTQKRDGSQRSR